MSIVINNPYADGERTLKDLMDDLQKTGRIKTIKINETPGTPHKFYSHGSPLLRLLYEREEREKGKI